MKIIKNSFENTTSENKNITKNNLQAGKTEKQRIFEKSLISAAGLAKIKGGIMAIDIDGL